MLNGINQGVIRRQIYCSNPIPQVQVLHSPDSEYKADFSLKHSLPGFLQPISFGYYFEFKKLEGLHCPCCGKEMTTNAELDAFKKSMANATDGQIIAELEYYKDRLPDTEREVANMIITAADEYPDYKLDALLRAIFKEPQHRLENRQKEILKEIKLLSKELTRGKTKDSIKKDIIAIDRIILEGKNGSPFKRKILIKGMEKLRDNETDDRNRDILEKIIKKAEDLPTSSSNANAFIVKYSRRDPEEIAYKILEPSQSTAEHINPHSKSGKDSPENYLVECKKCNNDRGNMSYVKWLDIHPEMIVNTQIYMDEIIDRIISGEIRGYDYYPSAVKRAVYQESQSLINLNVYRMIEYRRNKYKNTKPPANVAFSAGLKFNAVV